MLPIVLDWEPSPQRDLTETMQQPAGLRRFVLADLTEANGRSMLSITAGLEPTARTE
jgi:hypothetical protein